MAGIRLVCLALALVLLAGPSLAVAATPPSLLTEQMVQRYQGERTCDGGPGFAQIRSTLRVEAGAARSARYLEQPDALEQEQRIAADYDRVARIAAVRGCPDVARILWNLLLEDYKAPEHAAVRQRATEALRELDTSPTRRPR